MFRVTKSKAAVTLAIATMALPSAATAYTDPPSGRAGDSQSQAQNLRSADASDAGAQVQAHEIAASPDRQNLRSPDTSDAAAGRGTFSAPEITVVRVSEPTSSSSGLDWGDAGIGAAGLLAMILIGLGGTLFVLHRRHMGRPATG
jgi:hypothetical protein